MSAGQVDAPCGIAAFWRWFEANSARLLRVESCDEPFTEEVFAGLKAIHPDVGCEFGPTVDGRREFVVTAYGLRDAFPAVADICINAPELPGWRVIAFRPRIGPESVVEYNDVRLDYRDVFFRAEKDGCGAGIEIFVRGQTCGNENDLHQAIYILLDSALGEYDVEMKVGWIEITAVRDRTLPKGARPLEELPSIVDAMSAKANAGGPARCSEE